jgi:hypothetical protein
MLERRVELRNRMVKSAEIIAGGILICCVALDVSATGAHVYLPDSVLPPAQVVLWRVFLRLPDGTRRSARRIWQCGNKIGFKFHSDLSFPNFSPPDDQVMA